MEKHNLRIIEVTYHEGTVRYVIQKNFNFFGWTKWMNVSWDCAYETLEEAEEHIVEWLPKPKPAIKIIKII